jgi:hypothetical protein
MKIFVARGTGVIWRASVKELVAAGHQVRSNEINRLRTAGASVLVNAAIAEKASVYLHESITFVYRDGGSAWLDENSPVDDAGSPILRAALEGERAAAAACGAHRPRRLPGFLGKFMFGAVWNYFLRSHRISNARLKSVRDWRPSVRRAAEGCSSPPSWVPARALKQR